MSEGKKHRPIKIKNYDYAEKRESKHLKEHDKHRKSTHKNPKHDDTDKQSSKFLLYSILLLIFLFGIFSVVRFFYDPGTDTYNGFDCQEQGNFTYCEISVQQVNEIDGIKVVSKSTPFNLEFRNPPWELEDISIQGDVSELVDKNQTDFIYIAIPGDMEGVELAKIGIGAIEISRIVGTKYQIFNMPTETALIDQTVNYDTNITTVDCDDATDGSAVIMLGIGDRTFVEKRDDCYIIAGKNGDEIIKAADRLAYTLLGIMLPSLS